MKLDYEEFKKTQKIINEKHKKDIEYTKSKHGTELIKNYANILNILLEDSAENNKGAALETIKNLETTIENVKIYLESL